MESEPAPPARSETKPATSHRRSILVQVAVALGIVSATVSLLVVLSTRVKRDVVWMTPDQLARSQQPGPFTPFKRKVLNLTAPLWQRFRPVRPFVVISSKILAMPITSAETFDLKVPIATNEDGLRAWTLSSDQFKSLEQQIKSLPPERTIAAPRVSNASGGWASVSTGTSVVVQGTPRLAGIEITVRAKWTKSSWDFTCGLTATEPVGPLRNEVAVLRTNFAAACRANVPNAGALVIHHDTIKGTNFWVILSPVAVDPRGGPIKQTRR